MIILVIVAGILSILLILSLSYILFLQLQLRNINRQLTKRLEEKTRQPLTVELFNRDLNALVVNINRCLKEEELLRLDSSREEKAFKEVIANISHDLRTPLTAIRGYQQLLEKDHLTDKQRVRLQIAQKHAKELEGLIENFFKYSYLVTSDLKLNSQCIDLTNLVMEELAESVVNLEVSGLRINFQDGPQIFAMVDQYMTTRIIQNLIQNCIDHSAGDIEVSVSAEDWAIVSFRNPVNDKSKIDIDRIFDRFYTGDQARSRTTGLGLHIVQHLVQEMGGSVGASIENNIIEIMLRLPLC